MKNLGISIVINAIIIKSDESETNSNAPILEANGATIKPISSLDNGDTSVFAATIFPSSNYFEIKACNLTIIFRTSTILQKFTISISYRTIGTTNTILLETTCFKFKFTLINNTSFKEIFIQKECLKIVRNLSPPHL